MNEMFHKQVTALKILQERHNIVQKNNEYFPTWLGAVAIGVYIAVEVDSVIAKQTSVGLFLATISIYGMISSNLADLYVLQMKWANTFDPLKSLVTYFNMPTDLSRWKAANEHRMQLTGQAREELL